MIGLWPLIYHSCVLNENDTFNFETQILSTKKKNFEKLYMYIVNQSQL